MWREKLEAFCVGLQMENIPELLSNATVADFQRIGLVYSQRAFERIRASQSLEAAKLVGAYGGCKPTTGKVSPLPVGDGFEFLNDNG